MVLVIYNLLNGFEYLYHFMSRFSVGYFDGGIQMIHKIGQLFGQGHLGFVRNYFVGRFFTGIPLSKTKCLL